ncbi:MAG: flagellar biosynthesis protein FlhB [Phycisphaerae bacterium]
MPEQPASEKTEEATPHRLNKARQEGKIPQSQDVPTAMMLVALLLTLIFSAPAIFESFTSEVIAGVRFNYEGQLGVEGWVHRMEAMGLAAFQAIAPFLIAGVAVAVLAPLPMSGWVFSPKALKLDFGRINPVKGMKNLLSLKGVMKMLMSLAKLAVLGGLAWSYLDDRAGYCMSLTAASPGEIVVAVAVLVRGLMIRIVLAILALALADMLYQRFNYKKEMRMTKQEVKEETKQYEVNPHVKGRIRSIQREMARKRMLNAVPNADVVVTNPTHFAVALKYDSTRMNAPQVIAKGADLLCQRIKDIAKGHDVPIIERPPLARTLYATTEVGQSIPEHLYVAVAELLAMIFRLRKQAAKG